MKFIPYIKQSVDEDGNHRWSTIIENVASSKPICHIVSAKSQEEAEDNARQIYRLISNITLEYETYDPSIDLSDWPGSLRYEWA